MKLNKDTKKAKGFYAAYCNSCDYSIRDCYTTYSKAKAQAEISCVRKMVNMDGWGYKILSFNSQCFTCGWLYENEETGVVTLNVETAFNSYQIEY